MLWAPYQIRKTTGCACAGNVVNIFPATRLQRKQLVSDPGMHHGTCVTHVPWCMSGSLTRGGGQNVPRHSRCMRNPQFFVSGKKLMSCTICSRMVWLLCSCIVSASGLVHSLLYGVYYCFLFHYHRHLNILKGNNKMQKILLQMGFLKGCLCVWWKCTCNFVISVVLTNVVKWHKIIELISPVGQAPPRRYIVNHEIVYKLRKYFYRRGTLFDTTVYDISAP